MPTPAAPTVAEIGEHAVIARIRARVPEPPPWVSIGIGDDAAVVEPARNRAEVITTDALVEGVHFERAWMPPPAIGHKALAVNLSDLAAMGAEPRAAVLSLVLPPSLALADLDGMLDGWLALANRCSVALVGGNVARSPGPLVIDVTATGSVKPRCVLRREGASPGDEIYVSGTVGAAHAGRLACLRRASLPEPVGRLQPDEVAEPAGSGECESLFLRPEPRVRLGLLLGRNRVASSCVDLSDGLADGVHQIARASRVGAVVEAGALPIPAAARLIFEEHGLDVLDASVSGGEEYELLFTVPPRRRRAAAAVARLAGVPCTRIGVITAGRDLLLDRGGARVPLGGGFAHFR
jgi:thiamine-monophosphate kinase